MSIAASFRYITKAFQDWGTAQGVTTALKMVRDPLDLAEDEQVMLRYAAGRGKESRGGQGRLALTVEFHCMSKRGDLRDDGQVDRATVLASMIEAEFLQKDIDVYDIVNGNADTKIGSLQFLSSTWRNGDQRGTIYADGVDYSLETPKTEHWVVTMTATLNS